MTPAQTALTSASVALGDLLQVAGWFGLLALGIVGGVAYLRARR